MLLDILANSGDAFAWLLGCTAIGLVIDLAMSRLLPRHARRERLRPLGIALEGLRWAPTTMGAILGAGVAAQRFGFAPRTYSAVAAGIRVAAIVVVAAFTAHAAGGLVRIVTARKDVPLPSSSIFVNLVRGAVWVLAAASVLATVGVSVAPLITALGVGGLAVGLALQPTLENVFSGIQLLLSGQIKPGDFIRLDTGDEGTVLDVTWRNTTVRKTSNDVVLVPNSILARATVTNFSTADPEFVLVVPVSFASAGDPDLVHRIALEVAAQVIEDCPEAVPGQVPGAGFAELSPPAAVLNVAIRCRSYQQRIAVRHEFIRRLAMRFALEGIEAPPMPFSAERRV